MEAVRKATATADKAVEIGRRDLGITHGLDAVEGEVIGDQEQKVGTGRRRGGGGQRSGRKKRSAIHEYQNYTADAARTTRSRNCTQ